MESHQIKKQIYVASLDQSTTSTKFSVFTTNGKLVDQEIVQHLQISPSENYLQHDAEQIMKKVNISINNVIERMLKDQSFNIQRIKGLGICNQRQTVVCWDSSGKPLYNAIVWCDGRTKDICERFKQKYGQKFKEKTGLPVSTYFSLFKILWLIENVPMVKQQMQKGDIKFGTIDSWVVFNLTGRYVTDASNASRTYLCNLNGKWDKQLLEINGLKQEYLPQIVSSFGEIGTVNHGILKGIKIVSILGDQQSSAYSHSLEKDQMKITYGTGCFLLTNIGEKPIIHKCFITTILNKSLQKERFGYEIAVECGGGTLNWAKRIGLFSSYQELNHLEKNKSDLIFLPSFGSIFAPYWKDNVDGCFIGLSFNITRQNMIYSILQSIAFRLYDNIKYPDFKDVKRVVVDGGMTQNQFFMQMNSTLFNKQIEVCALDTCWGVAKGVIQAQNITKQKIIKVSKIYKPQQAKHQELVKRYQRWNKKRNQAYGWIQNQ